MLLSFHYHSHLFLVFVQSQGHYDTVLSSLEVSPGLSFSRASLFTCSPHDAGALCLCLCAFLLVCLFTCSAHDAAAPCLCLWVGRWGGDES